MNQTGHPDPAVLELRRLQDKVDELCEEQRYMMRALLNRDDRHAGLVLLPLVAELLGSSTFTAPSLLKVAFNARTPVGQAAREVLADMATDSGGLRAFGRLLVRLEGVALAGCRLQAAGETSEGRRWRLTRVSDDE